MHEQVVLEVTRHRVHRVRHRGRGRRTPTDLHHDGLPEILARQRLDFGRHGGAEQQRLTVARHLFDNAVQLRREAHVEHAIRFVEHQRLEIREIDVALLEVIEQSSRRGHHDVDAAAQRTLLRFVPNAAKHRDHIHRSVLGILANALLDLETQLAGRRENQNARPTRTAQQTVYHRQREAGRLASARLGKADQIAAF